MAPSVTDNPPSRNCNEDEDDDLSLPASTGVTINYDSEESESESEDPSNSGYELLPQEPENEPNPASETREDDEEAEVEELDAGVPENEAENEVRNNATKLTRNEEQVSESSCSVTPWVTGSPTMDQDHINKIKAAMAGFHLPSTCIPSWAAAVPEEQWKKHLLQRMNLRTKEDSK